MTPIWQQSPDGRPVARDPDGPQHIAYPSSAEAKDQGRTDPLHTRRSLETLEPFVAGSIAALPEPPGRGAAPTDDRQGTRLGLLLFLIGAAEAFAARRSLKRDDVLAGLPVLLKRHGLQAWTQTDLMTLLPALAQEPMARAAFTKGATALDDWLSGHDQNLPLLVRELASDWQRRLSPLSSPMQNPDH